MRLQTVDYHTAGEPFRIVSSPVPQLVGSTVLERRSSAMRGDLDRIRQLLVNEPRGHADMYGCIVTPPDDDGADLGAIFFHNAGYSTACGHGTIALATWAREAGVVDRAADRVVIDVPSGRVEAHLNVQEGRLESVRFRNVPAYELARDIPVETSFGSASVAVACGGAFYAEIAASALGIELSSADLPRLIAAGRELKTQLEQGIPLVDVAEPQITGLYGVIFHERVPSDDGILSECNVTIFADGEVDRSPCGSGTSARLASLVESGELEQGQLFRNVGIAGVPFLGRVVAATTVGGKAAVVTEIEGIAYLTGYHTFVLTDDDPLGTGFLLR
jgi:proline racemase